MTPRWQPYREPLRATVLRNGLIAVVAGAVVARFWGGPGRWPLATLLVLWPSFGGHWLEVWFLNWLRPRLSAARGVQVATRLVVWFLGGILLAGGMYLTLMALTRFRPVHWPAWWAYWWIGGLGFIGVELVAHLALQLSGRPGFYDGRG